MNQSKFAAHVGASPAAVSRWKARGWLVFSAPGVIDVDATMARLLEVRGQTQPMTRTQASRLSGWSRSPHCQTERAFEHHRRFRG